MTDQPETVESKLARLAELQAQADVERLDFEKQRATIIPPEVADALTDLEAEYLPKKLVAEQKIAELRDEIIREVVDTGASVKSAGYHVIFRSGAVTWDTKALTGYAAAHPEIEKFRKVGSASASLQAEKR